MGSVPENLSVKIPFVTSFTVSSTSISDNIILTLLLLTLANFWRDKDRSDIFRRFIVVYGTLELMRTVTVLLTSLPDASEKCRMLTPIGDLPSGASTWSAIFNPTTMTSIIIHTLKILIPVHPITCGDMIFSGHSNSAFCLAMTWHTYYKWVPQKVNVVKTGIWLMALAACFTLGGLVFLRVNITKKFVRFLLTDSWLSRPTGNAAPSRDLVIPDSSPPALLPFPAFALQFSPRSTTQSMWS